jgi:1A family penicillin-binding protein
MFRNIDRTSPYARMDVFSLLLSYIILCEAVFVKLGIICYPVPMSPKSSEKLGDTKEISQNKPKKKHKKPKKKFFLKFLYVSLFLFVLVVAILASLATYLYFNTPSVNTLTSSKITQTSVIYDRTGQHVLYEIHGEENRKVISHDEIPASVRLATIAAEDNEFYSHKGIDPKAIIRSLKADVSSNEIQQGGSTITQQLARNVFLTREKTFKRKIFEVILAFKIEMAFSKDEILDMYLNEIPYGSNAYGIESASETFFGKKAAELTMDESALLAALPNATSLYSPYGNHVSDLIRRKNKILTRMSELNLASNDETQEARQTETMYKVIPFKQSIDCPHFVFYIKEQLEKKYGQDILETGGFQVYTTLDYDLQKKAEEIVKKNVATVGAEYGATNAALVSIDPKNGQVLAMVGSKDYFDKSIDGQVNVAISPRQPGSSFKPFAYAEAFEKGYQPENMLYDVPTDFGVDGSGQSYKPNNYDGSFHGLVSMRQALAGSLNIPAVKTLYLAGIKDTIDMAHRLGITTLNDTNRYGLALVLGGGEVTLLDETASYSVFGNDGKKNSANGILKIIGNDGNTFYESAPENTQTIHPEIARKINSILSDNSSRSLVFGSGSKLYIPGRQVAAKTGTTQEFHDAWTVGYTPSIATGVWVGNNNNDAMKSGADGSYVAAPIWNDFMTEALKNYPDERFIDYDKAASYALQKSGIPEIKYVRKSTGKEVSADKAAKADKNKIEAKVSFSDNFSSQTGIPLVVEMQNTTDPMILRWRDAISNPDILANINQLGSDPSKNSQDKKN